MKKLYRYKIEIFNVTNILFTFPFWFESAGPGSFVDSSFKAFDAEDYLSYQ